ncbi:hypothetical protein [Saccharothrix luteola]|uniref:hypothetical protein n=1 Tax=Saccharothrix luteola TaxID=2893018 RepID=UPI001E46B0DA|nr:hypothetical protein [Saccharothrix luteola]MCC8247640.1 hypothetical protein [Saccharothrix luteola]
MNTTDVGNLDPGWPFGPVRGTGVTEVVGEVVAQRGRTSRARVRGRTMVELAGVLGGTGVGAEITVAENDGSRWSMTVRPTAAAEGRGHVAGEDASA